MRIRDPLIINFSLSSLYRVNRFLRCCKCFRNSLRPGIYFSIGVHTTRVGLCTHWTMLELGRVVFSQHGFSNYVLF